MATSVVLDKVVKNYGTVPVIHGIDLQIDPGEFAVFVGPSGCGKSTLLRMIAGLEEISGGSLLLDGERMNEVPAANRGIAMVFQSYALYPHMTVWKNLAFGLETAGLKRSEIEPRVRRAAQILRIEPLLERKPKALSGGQRQRVAIGRAIVREPKIFLFDEPLSNLDAELRVQMRVELSALHRDLGNTMIYVTHDQVEAMTMADKIVVLNGGRIEQVGAPLELYNHPVNRFVAGFIGSPKMNFLDGRIAAREDGSTVIEVGGASVRLPRTLPGAVEGEPVALGVRPEHLSVDPALGIPLGEVKVDLIENLGGETLLYARAGDGQKLTVSLDGQQRVTPGAAVTAHFDPVNAHVFDPDGRAL
jgi:multiple sugar transport system ATP-binding protein